MSQTIEGTRSLKGVPGHWWAWREVEWVAGGGRGTGAGLAFEWVCLSGMWVYWSGGLYLTCERAELLL